MPMPITGSVQCHNHEVRVTHLQVKNVLKASANLDDRTKVIAEYWADFPGSNLPPGAGACETCTHGSMCSKIISLNLKQLLCRSLVPVHRICFSA